MGSSQTVLPLVGDDGRIADPAQRVALIGEFLPAISVCGLIDHDCRRRQRGGLQPFGSYPTAANNFTQTL